MFLPFVYLASRTLYPRNKNIENEEKETTKNSFITRKKEIKLKQFKNRKKLRDRRKNYIK